MLKPKIFKVELVLIKTVLSYNNSLELKKIKRFYIVQNKKNNFVRAWHGHKLEAKYIMCIKGKK